VPRTSVATYSLPRHAQTSQRFGNWSLPGDTTQLADQACRRLGRDLIFLFGILKNCRSSYELLLSVRITEAAWRPLHTA